MYSNSRASIKTLHVLFRFELESFLRAIQEHRINHLPIVPPIATVLAKHPEVTPSPLATKLVSDQLRGSEKFKLSGKIFFQIKSVHKVTKNKFSTKVACLSAFLYLPDYLYVSLFI